MMGSMAKYHQHMCSKMYGRYEQVYAYALEILQQLGH